MPVSEADRQRVYIFRHSPYWHPHRLITSVLGLRMHPSFLIIGTQKGGSTSLYNYLVAHPSIQAASVKETHFFDYYAEKSHHWYLSHFPLKRTKHLRMSGEASPSYLFYPDVPERVRDILPNVKLIVLLRNPIERAYSHYRHVCRYGFEPLSFEEAVLRELQLRESPDFWARVIESRREGRGQEFYCYFSRGLYASQLRRWESFFPREQQLILKSEDFFSNTAEVYARVERFLGLAPTGRSTFPPYNQGSTGQGISTSFRKRLIELYSGPNKELAGHVDFGIRDWI